MTTYLLAGGGTAGHVNPMLALADSLRDRDPECDIIIVGTAEGLEARLVPLAGYSLHVIEKLPFPRRPNRAAAAFPRRWAKTVSHLRSLISERAVDVVIGVGGYAAAPAYAAARACRVPIVVHEANARPGLANRLGALWTRFVGVAIAGTKLPHARLVGMPLRREFESSVTLDERHRARRAFGLDLEKPTIVVTGGSLGARRLNLAISQAVPQLLEAGLQVLHITGHREHEVHSNDDAYKVIEYSDRMRDALACADLVISRAGASTVCEIAALGLPAVFVPYPVGNGEQKFNAQPLVHAGAAILVDDALFTAQWVRANVVGLVRDRESLQRMAIAAARMGIRDGATRLCELVDEARATVSS